MPTPHPLAVACLLGLASCTASPPTLADPEPPAPTMVPAMAPPDPTRPIVAVGVGSDHTCFARDDGFVWCRGRLPSPDASPDPVEPWQVGGVADAVELVGGAGHACARLEDATVRCWGRADLGQHGDGQLGDDVDLAASTVRGLDDAVDLDATSVATCAVRSTGRVVCWGEVSMSRLVDAERQIAAEPIVIEGIEDATRVGISGRQGCALHAEGTVSCWGDLPGGEDAGALMTFSAPTPVPDLDQVVDLAVLQRTACALRADGSLWCWGIQHHTEVWHDHDGFTGHVEQWQTTLETPARQFPAGTLRHGLAAGDHHACALATDGGVRCWSDLPDPELGAPLASADGRTLVAVAVADTPWDGHGCMLDDTGALGCWGSNREGQLGDGTLAHGPRSLDALGPLRALELGRGRTCGLDEAGTVHCLGSNELGALGDGTEHWRHTPAPVRLDGPVERLFMGAIHSCVLLRDDPTPRCWGYGFYGQLGVETSGQSRPVPVAVEGWPPGRTLVDMALTAESTCALLDDASVWCWGKRPGTRGFDDDERSATPAPVDALGPARALAAGSDAVCAVRDDDGQVWCLGPRGDTPAQVTGLSGDGDVLEVHLGARHGCARLDDGAVRCWDESLVAVPLDGLDGFATDLAVGGRSVCARTDDGAVRCQRDGAAPWREVVGVPDGALRAGAEHTCVLARDTRLATCWGSNWSGELGLERTWTRTGAWDGEVTR